MGWEDEYKRKLVSPEGAVREIRSGDHVRLGWGISAPFTLCQALGKRKDEVEGVTATACMEMNEEELAYVDHVVTEYGLARLFGKTIKERVNELISIAHPDFRSELREAARKLSWL